MTMISNAIPGKPDSTHEYQKQGERECDYKRLYYSKTISFKIRRLVVIKVKVEP